MRWLTPLLFVVLVAGCTSADDATTTIAPTTTAASPVTTTAASTTSTTMPATTTTAVTTTTAATTTTTTAATTTSATALGPFVVGTPGLFPPVALSGSDGAAGSGCAPGPGGLPDGIWFGYVSARSGTDVAFDLACFYFGDIAYDEGAKDGEEVNNDYYVRNVNPALRSVIVDASMPVYEISSTDSSFATVPFADWPIDPTGYIACPSDWCGVWLYVNDGEVTEIVEQYVP